MKSDRLPFDPATEDEVIGFYLCNPDAPLDDLVLSTFHDPRNRALFAAIERLHADGIPVAGPTILAHLKQSGHLSDAGGEDRVNELAVSFPSPGLHGTHLDHLRSLHRRRQTIAYADTLSRAAFEGDDEAVADTVAKLSDTAPSTTNLFQNYTVAALLSADRSFVWDAKGMLVRPTYGMDAGELKSMKSYWGIGRAIGLAAGVPIFGQWEVPERRRVQFYVGEGGRRSFTARFERLCEAHGVDPAELDGWLRVSFDVAPLDSPKFRASLRRDLATFKPNVVHLDPLYTFQPVTVSSSQYAQVGAMLADLQRTVADADASLIITAHMNQTGAGFDLKRVSGAGISEWGDTWTLIRHREPPDAEAGRFRLEVEIGSRQWGGASW